MPSYFTVQTSNLPNRPGTDGTGATEYTVGDFNGDGKVDVILSYFYSPLQDKPVPVRFLSGDGKGAFTDTTAATFGANVPVTTQPRESVVADFNGDGRPDIFIADHGYDREPFPGAQNTLMLSSGATGFVNATDRLPQVKLFTHSAEAVDIDGDGDLDIYVGNENGKGASLLINDGTGHFTSNQSNLPSLLTDQFTHQQFSSVAFFDADGDGDLDMFVGTATDLGTASRLLLNDGHGKFTLTDQLLATPAGKAAGDHSVDAQAYDFNGDGRQDVMVEFNLHGTRFIQAWISDGHGGLTDQTASYIPAAMQGESWSLRPRMVDLNGDGFTDIVLSNGSAHPVFLNNGMGQWVAMPSSFLPALGGLSELMVADVNGDGRMDIIDWEGTGPGTEQIRTFLAIDPGGVQIGTNAADGFMGDGDAETMSGLGGDDVIFAGGGNDSVTAGTGNDTIDGGAGQNYLRGDEGDDSINGGSGFDDSNGNMGNDTIHGNGGDDYSVGGKGDDLLFGDNGNDIVWGNLGNDTCDGGDGNDQVRGGQGDDSVSGGAGNDFVSGDRGNDTISGGAGADIFHGSQDAGIDRVLDFKLSEGDRVQLDPGTTYTLSQVGADTVIDMGGSNQMILVGVQMSTLTPGWIFGA